MDALKTIEAQLKFLELKLREAADGSSYKIKQTRHYYPFKSAEYDIESAKESINQAYHLLKSALRHIEEGIKTKEQLGETTNEHTTHNHRTSKRKAGGIGSNDCRTMFFTR